VRLTKEPNINSLIYNGYSLQVDNGILKVKKQVDSKVIEIELACDEQEELEYQLCNRLKTPVYKFIYHTTGKFNGGLSMGVSLQFINLESGETAYITYNADITRSRNTKYGKKGDPKPKGQFTVRKHHAFTRFWRRMNLPLPVKLSTFHERMYMLKSVLLLADIDNNKRGKLVKDTVQLLSLNSKDIQRIFSEQFIDNSLPSDQHIATNSSTNMINMNIDKVQEYSDFQVFKGAGDNKYGLRQKGRTVTRFKIDDSTGNSRYRTTEEVQKQSHEEWLADLGG
jgi:hypothetical protein